MTKIPYHLMHIQNPSNNAFIDHNIVIDTVDNRHRYRMSCRQCGCYVKWASEAEYLWFMYYNPTARFRDLYWAPKYDPNFQKLYHELELEKTNQKLGE